MMNSSINPFKIALMNTMFANNNVKNMRFELGSPKKAWKNSSHMLDTPNEEYFTKRKDSIKKFTCLPNLIKPITCEEDYEEDEKKNSGI